MGETQTTARAVQALAVKAMPVAQETQTVQPMVLAAAAAGLMQLEEMVAQQVAVPVVRAYQIALAGQPLIMRAAAGVGEVQDLKQAARAVLEAAVLEQTAQMGYQAPLILAAAAAQLTVQPELAVQAGQALSLFLTLARNNL